MVRTLLALAASAAALLIAPAAKAAVAPVAWCGSGTSQTDRAPDRMGGPQVHVAYVIPSDGVDRFASIVSALATDVAAIDAWWRREDPTRAPRFDLFEFPRCGTTLGRLDVTFARLPDSTATLGTGDRRHDAISFRLGRPPFSLDNPTKKYLVFYDGGVFDPNLCGTGSGSPTRGGIGSIAIVALRSSCGLGIGGGLQNATVAAHELLHAFGALPFGAPNACPNDDGHPCDDERDLLFPFLRDKTLDATLLDGGRNDYYGHSGTWFDLQDSLWLLRAQEQVTLTVTPSGGGGAVRVGETECRTVCATDWDAGTAVPLVARPASGFVFRGWTGACSGRSGACSVTVRGPLAAGAVFARLVRLALSVSGRGIVTAGSVRCARSCSARVATGDRVAVRARAAQGWRFVRWAGSCRGTRPTCTVRVRAAAGVRAIFARR